MFFILMKQKVVKSIIMTVTQVLDSEQGIQLQRDEADYGNCFLKYVFIPPSYFFV